MSHSHGWVFLICCLYWWDVSLSLDLCPQLRMQGALLTFTCIVQYENIDRWCYSAIDKWRGIYLIHSALKHIPSHYLENKMRAIIPQAEPSAAVHPRLSPKWVWMDVISSNATNIGFIPSTFLSRLMAAYYLSLCTSGLMNFTYKHHADTDMLCKGLVS